MIKKTLKLTLCALLLAASGSAFAQDEAEVKEVKLADGTTTSWSNFVGAINNPSSVAVKVDSTALHTARMNYYAAVKEANEAPEKLTAATNKLNEIKAIYNTANDSLTAYKDQRDLMSESQKYTTGPVGWLKTIRTSATEFQTYYNSYCQSQGKQNGTDGKISYFADGSDRWGYNLYISFSGVPASIAGEWQVDKNVSTFEEAIYGKKYDHVYLYLGKNEDGDDNYPDNNGLLVLSYNGSSTSMANTIVSAINTLAKEDGYYEQTPTTTFQTLLDNISEKTARVKSLSEKQAAAEKAYNEASAAVTNSTSKLSSTKATFDDALSDYNKAVADAGNAFNNYLDVTLLADIEASTPVTRAFNGSINAENHIITVPQGVNLFGTSYFSNGQLHNAIINGVFATGGKYYNVAAWRGANGIYYDDHGNNGGTVTNIGKLAYDNRDLQFFSADIEGKKLVKWTDDIDNHVYDITLYQPNATTQFYTNLNNGVFVNNPISEVSKNAFYESKTNDFGNIDNVIVGKTCANVVIEDKASFYCPFDITATNVTLNRKLNAGYNTVCLPFEMTPTKMGLGENDLLCTYDRETSTKFWFNKTNKVDANTPALVYLATAKESTTLSGVTIKQTKSQLVNYDGANDDPSQACGLFKNTTADDIRGASKAQKVYGLQGGSNIADAKFNPAAGTATFGAFRMVIVSEIAAAEAAQGLPQRVRGIAVVDEKGIEINPGEVSGVEIIDMESSSLTVTPGRGEIIITTDANYGMQTVYTMDGKTVATVNVVEGTNTVNVPSGIYVVMGRKVMVE